MILPTKHLPEDRSLVGVGSDILKHLREPRAVSELWAQVRSARAPAQGEPGIGYDTFILALTFLHMIFAIDLRDGLIHQRRPDA